MVCYGQVLVRWCHEMLFQYGSDVSRVKSYPAAACFKVALKELSETIGKINCQETEKHIETVNKLCWRDNLAEEQITDTIIDHLTPEKIETMQPQPETEPETETEEEGTLSQIWKM